jgi:8-oxo-dGTP pyrophosphatase MutT (NUDIX family)
MKPWVILSSTVLVDRRWMRLHEQRILLPNGAIIEDFHLIESPSWVAVLALTDDGEIVLVEQFRNGLGRVSRELPAGVIDPGEAPEDTARRELREETGYVADSLIPLTELSPEPNRSTHRGHFFVAKAVRYSGHSTPEPSEVLEVIRRPIALVIDDAIHGRIDHAAHVAAILVAHARGLLVPTTSQG